MCLFLTGKAPNASETIVTSMQNLLTGAFLKFLLLCFQNDLEERERDKPGYWEGSMLRSVHCQP